MTHLEQTPQLDKFKKFGGEYIEDMVAYVRDYVKANPGMVVAVGCDSQQLRKSTCYVTAIVMYNPGQRNGAHVVFLREFVKKIFNPKHDVVVAEKLKNGKTKPYFDSYREIHPRLFGEIERVSLYANLLHEGLVETYWRNDMTKDEAASFDKLVDAHLDLNPDPGSTGQNKSNMLWAAGRGMLEGMGFRTFTKPNAHAASCAADLLCK